MKDRYRLIGEVGGRHRAFLLSPGTWTAGSAPTEDGDLVLPVPGVSRRHATLTVTEDGLTVEDLESKNGTFLNGRRVAQGRPEPGDTVAFGPVRLRLEAVAPEDAELGLELSGGAVSWSGLSSGKVLGHTPSLPDAAGRSGGSGASLRLLQTLLARLTLRPAPDLEGFLAVLTAALGATAGALAEFAPGGPPVVLAATPSPPALSDLPELPSLRTLRSAAASGRDADGCCWATAEAADGGLLALLLWGDDLPPGEEHRLWPATALELARAFLPGQLAQETDRQTGRKTRTLVFPEDIVPGDAPAMVAFYQQMEQLLVGDFPILLVGETGVGKEHLAQVLHRSSPLGAGPFVAVNCAAIPAELLEAEMFGVVRGAATGVEARPGKFVEADGGVLFLDEVGEMAPDLQAKLLRALQEGEVHPVGGKPRRVAVRVVAATNADLLARAEEGRFRSDLYYRLAGYVLEVPPLRRRREDLPRLLGHFVRRFSHELKKPVRGVTVKALRLLTAAPWPGNVRELEHVARRLVVVCPRDGAIDSALLPPEIVEAALDVPEVETGEDLVPQLEALERRLIQRALLRTGGNQTRAAERLGISRNGLGKRLKRLGINPAELIPS